MTLPAARSIRLLLAIASALTLAACGGGVGDASTEPLGSAPHASTGVAELDAATPADMGQRSVALAWSAPRTNDDGSALTDLAGYRIYYGSHSGSYGAFVTLNDPAASSYHLGGLAPGTWYIVVKAVNRAGAQSIASPEVSKTIQ